jgi:hypothetical protein
MVSVVIYLLKADGVKVAISRTKRIEGKNRDF